MSSEDQEKSRQELLKEYEKDYLQRLQKGQQDTPKQEGGQNLQNLIYDLSADFKKEEEAKDYVGLCTFCMMGVPRQEMTYKNRQLFHQNCFEQQGKNFPVPDREILKENANAKVQLAILKNLKVRTGGSSSSVSKHRPKTKKKSKRKTKKRRPKRRIVKRRKTKRRALKRRQAKRRRAKPKRRKTVRRKKIRRKSRRSSRTRRRRVVRRKSRRSSSKKRRPRRR